MNITRTIEFIRENEKELCLFNVDGGASTTAVLSEYFATQNVRIRSVRTASGAPEGVAVLSDPGEVLAVVDVSTLRDLTIRTPSGAGGVGIADDQYEAILDHLKESTFTSYDTSQMLAASREIEDRARRVGSGTIHAGFQQLSRMAAQRRIYADLAARGVAVHTYGVPDAPEPDLSSGVVHAIETEEIATTWFVVFDGGGDDAQKSALLAEERGEENFYGAWTYDPRIVDHVTEYLQETYLSASDDFRMLSD